MKIKQKIYIQAIKFNHQDEFRVEASTYKNKSDCIQLAIDIDETEIEISIGDFTQEDFTKAHIEQLKEVKKKLMADTQVQIQSLDDQIESLQCLDHIEGEGNE